MAGTEKTASTSHVTPNSLRSLKKPDVAAPPKGVSSLSKPSPKKSSCSGGNRLFPAVT
jgi:hypothetical protein